MSAAAVEHDQVAEVLEQLAALESRCEHCSEPINRFEMLIAWPAAGVIAHFACYVELHGLGKLTAIPSQVLGGAS